MRRSASDESLLNDTATEQHIYDERDTPGLLKKRALHRKGRAPPPPPPLSTSPPSELQEATYSCYSASPMLRSKSAHLLCETETPACTYMSHETSGTPLQTSDVGSGHRKALRVTPPPEDWSRSRSTPHIAATSLDDADRSYDSSTLSDDDSTPHVSRSNSRGKDCAAANSAWESAYGSSPASELLVHAAPVNIHEETGSDSEHHPPPPVPQSPPRHHASTSDTSAPPLPPKRSSADVKLRHLPPVHVESPAARHSTIAEEMISWEWTDRKAPERKGRLRHRDMGARMSQRSKSLPPPPGESRTEGITEDANKTSDCVQNQSAATSFQGEISWSVSQLRNLFAESTRPPPYRPPPSVIPSHRAPITSYHLGNSSQSERYVISQRLLLDPGPRLRGLDSTDEEESYV